ncbi:MAG: hypothetical protein U9O94_05270 [Nanoarchaeota archaeon]|nr:hypothetical protein [Nanoarchaeota archaeon]
MSLAIVVYQFGRVLKRGGLLIFETTSWEDELFRQAHSNEFSRDIEDPKDDSRIHRTYFRGYDEHELKKLISPLFNVKLILPLEHRQYGHGSAYHQKNSGHEESHPPINKPHTHKSLVAIAERA